MNVAIRPTVPADAEACGRIIYDAFKDIADRHGFPPHYPNVEVAIQRATSCIGHPSIFGVVAESESKLSAPTSLTSAILSEVWDRLLLTRRFRYAAPGAA